MGKIILSLFFIFILIIIKIYTYKKYNLRRFNDINNKVNKITKYLFLLGIIFFIIISLYKKNINNIIILILFFPSTLNNLYNYYFYGLKNKAFIKTIISNKYPKEDVYRKYKKAKINIIVFTKDNNKLKFKELDKIEEKYLQKNLVIKNDKIDNIKKYLKEDEYLVVDDYEKEYKKILVSRGRYNNFLKCFSYIIAFYIPLILSYVLFSFNGIPYPLDYKVIIFLKVFILIIALYLFKYLPVEKIDNYFVKNKYLINLQEVLLLLIQSLIVFFSLSLIYMYFLTNGASVDLSKEIYLILFIYSYLFMYWYMLSDSMTLVNAIKSFSRLRMIIFNIIYIVSSLIIYYFSPIKMGLRNYISCIVMAFIVVVAFDMEKLARFDTVRRRKKNEYKINKR